ncbi:MAG: hypothetical protein RI909_1286 [Bacteroidota bacterium]
MTKKYLIKGCQSTAIGVSDSNGFHLIKFTRSTNVTFACERITNSEKEQALIEATDRFKRGGIICIEEEKEVEEVVVNEPTSPVDESNLTAEVKADTSSLTTISQVKEFLNKEHNISYSRMANIEAIRVIVKELGLTFNNVKSL